VRVAWAPGDEKEYGNQDTDGSRSVRHYVQPMRDTIDYVVCTKGAIDMLLDDKAIHMRPAMRR